MSAQVTDFEGLIAFTVIFADNTAPPSELRALRVASDVWAKNIDQYLTTPRARRGYLALVETRQHWTAMRSDNTVAEIVGSIWNALRQVGVLETTGACGWTFLCSEATREAVQSAFASALPATPKDDDDGTYRLLVIDRECPRGRERVAGTPLASVPERYVVQGSEIAVPCPTFALALDLTMAFYQSACAEDAPGGIVVGMVLESAQKEALTARLDAAASLPTLSAEAARALLEAVARQFPPRPDVPS